MDQAYVSSGVNLSEIVPINQKRLTTFTNYWVSNMVSLLNHFVVTADSKLLQVERKIEHIETVLTLLEAKLNSVPNLNVDVPPKQQPVTNAVDHKTVDVVEARVVPEPEQFAPTVATVADESAVPPDPQTQGDASNAASVSNTASNDVAAKNDPRYQKYFKMLQMGVPVVGVKQKLQWDDLDPNILDNPDAIIPPAVAAAERVEDSGDSSVASFSSDED